MNFGERLKRLRTDRGLTQPQFAALAGIEQSYLSKLENDKSVPSAEMFDTLVAALGIDAPAFLQELDRELLDTTLRHIPAVNGFRTQAVAQQVRHTRRWLFGSAAAWLLGFAMMLAANDGIFFSNKLYQYSSPGVIRAGEAENIFETYREIISLRMQARVITPEAASLALSEFQANRMRPVSAEWTHSRGSFYLEGAQEGRRRFALVNTRHVQAEGNRILQYLGALVLAGGFVGLFIEWRLRRLKNKQR